MPSSHRTSNLVNGDGLGVVTMWEFIRSDGETTEEIDANNAEQNAANHSKSDGQGIFYKGDFQANRVHSIVSSGDNGNIDVKNSGTLLTDQQLRGLLNKNEPVKPTPSIEADDSENEDPITNSSPRVLQSLLDKVEHIESHLQRLDDEVNFLSVTVAVLFLCVTFFFIVKFGYPLAVSAFSLAGSKAIEMLKLIWKWLFEESFVEQIQPQAPVETGWFQGWWR